MCRDQGQLGLARASVGQCGEGLESLSVELGFYLVASGELLRMMRMMRMMMIMMIAANTSR